MLLLPIPAFDDNYIWLFSDGKAAWVVDPGDAAPVIAALQDRQLALAGILLTHHHGDHTGGITALCRKFAVPVYGPAESPARELVSHPLRHGDHIQLGHFHFCIIAVPGHTLDHIAFHSAADKLLFCGDTLFSAGCGRVFEGTYAQMHASLQLLAALPDDTRVCCAHEYTLSNLRFAVAVEPDNQAIRDYQASCELLCSSGQPTLPSLLGLEKQVNPFLRCRDVEEFSARREWKNRY